jgi:hypothetical protein
MISMDRFLSLASAATVLAALAFSCQAAAAERAQPFGADLAPKVTKHGVECPLPGKGLCVIKKPVGRSYRVLSAGVNLEDMGDYWLADFSKSKDPARDRETLRVLGGNGELHEIDVLFSKETVVKEKPAAKPVRPAKDAAK